jgi:hypothetical protein
VVVAGRARHQLGDVARLVGRTGPGQGDEDGMTNVQTAERLAAIRGGAKPRRHNARTIAALTRNPGCDRRAVLDGAGVDEATAGGNTSTSRPGSASRRSRSPGATRSRRR